MSVLNKRIAGLKKEGNETAKMITDEYKPLLDTNNDVL